MITLNDTPTTDNEIIWIFELDTDSTTFYLSDVDITLSGVAYHGDVLVKDDIGAIKSAVGSKGGVGSVAFSHISISRFNTLTGLSDYFNDYVDYSYFTGSTLRIGCVWLGATTQAEITWFHEMQVDTPSYDDLSYSLDSVEAPEYENKELPYYVVQNTYNNGVSYFPNASGEVLGATIPLVYGSFPQLKDSELYSVDYWDSTFILTPGIAVDQGSGKFIFSSHELHNISETWVYKFSSGLNNYISILATDKAGPVSADSNTMAGTSITLLSSAGGRVYGQTFIHPTGNFGSFLLDKDGSARDSLTGGYEVFDRDNSSYFELTAGDSVNLRFDTDGLEAYLSTSNAISNKNIVLKILGQTITGNNVLRAGIYKILANDKGENLQTVGAADYYFDFNFTSTLGYQANRHILKFNIPIKSLFEYVLRLTNTGATTIRIYEALLRISGIPVTGYYVKSQATINSKYLRTQAIIKFPK